MSDFDKWYDDPLTKPMSVHSNIEKLLKDYCRQSWNAAREATIEECARECERLGSTLSQYKQIGTDRCAAAIRENLLKGKP